MFSIEFPYLNKSKRVLSETKTVGVLNSQKKLLGKIIPYYYNAISLVLTRLNNILFGIANSCTVIWS